MSVVILTLLFGAVALVVAMPIGLPAFLWSLSHGVDWKALLTSPGLWSQVTLIATFVGLCYLLTSLPGDGVLPLLPASYSATLVFYDARPDIGELLFPEWWRTRGPEPAAPMATRHHGQRRKR